MIIEPNSKIRLIKNCPLDITQEHTLWFDTIEEQKLYFLGLEHIEFTAMSYQRHARGVLRVPGLCDNLLAYNYMIFNNDIEGVKKWFFCFISEINYINTETTEIVYIIDDMQTWFFDYELKACFIDREHSATDEIGDNLVPEGLETGDYISTGGNIYVDELKRYSVCIASTVEEDEDGDIVDSKGGVYGGIFSGLTFKSFSMDSAGLESFQAFIEKVTSAGKSEGISSVFLMPSCFVTESPSWNPWETNRIVINLDTNYGVKRSDGNLPKNNKLNTYPYCYLYCTNMQGTSAIFHYEYFNAPTKCGFAVVGDYSPTPSVILSPVLYKQVGEPNPENFDEKITLSGFPQLPFNIDTFKAWVAQNRGSLAMNAISTGVGFIQNSKNIAFDTGLNIISNPTKIGGITSVAQGAQNQFNNVVDTALDIGNQLASVYDKSIMPNQAKGGGSPLTLATFGYLNFLFLHKHIRPEFVDIIDDYFSMFGYACHRVKVPNRNVREEWTYTRTKGCVLVSKANTVSAVPAPAIANISAIYNRGITFWRHPENVGDYSLPNPIIV